MISAMLRSCSCDDALSVEALVSNSSRANLNHVAGLTWWLPSSMKAGDGPGAPMMPGARQGACETADSFVQCDFFGFVFHFSASG